MLISVVTLLFLTAPSDDLAARQIAAPCRVVDARAVQYFESHGFYADSSSGNGIYTGRRAAEPREIVIKLANSEDPENHSKHLSTPSGKPLSLNRFNVPKYTLPRHLSPLKAYSFDLGGNLRLIKVSEEACYAYLHFEFSAWEWVWALGVIDDGFSSKFVSNGTLERIYLDPIADLFTSVEH